ncbi:hypothetical protein OWV82_003721 [Melia azedarach]|uniref:Uncharacterized protein n=1 Tax=Melia azedarach TaxID=155640 RepID=A0ACC1YM49_MELAZ|nr:hypothetical protein OWV82_003721 [Melia azedarach]
MLTVVSRQLHLFTDMPYSLPVGQLNSLSKFSVNNWALSDITTLASWPRRLVLQAALPSIHIKCCSLPVLQMPVSLSMLDD